MTDDRTYCPVCGKDQDAGDGVAFPATCGGCGTVAHAPADLIGPDDDYAYCL